MGDDTAADDLKTVTLTKSNCPSWVNGCTAYVTVHDGKLDGVALYTKRRNAMNAVTRDLTAKYGKPTTFTPEKFSSLMWEIHLVTISLRGHCRVFG